MPGSSGGALLWTLIALVLLIGHGLLFGFVIDDAFISFRYAQNLDDQDLYDQDLIMPTKWMNTQGSTTVDFDAEREGDHRARLRGHEGSEQMHSARGPETECALPWDVA